MVFYCLALVNSCYSSRFKDKPSDLHTSWPCPIWLLATTWGQAHVSDLKRVINVKYTQDVTDLVQKQKLRLNLFQYLYFDYMFKWYWG